MASTPHVMVDRFKAIILDFDGVVLDSERPQLTAWEWALKTNNYPVSPDKIRLTVGWRDIDIVRTLVTQDQDDLRVRVLQAKQTKMNEYYEAGKVKLVPGISEFVQQKSSSHLLAIASNSRRERIADHLSQLGDLAKCFSHIVTGEGHLRPKPYPDVYQEVMRVIGLSANECVVIEDSVVGLQAASAAGLPRIGLTNIFTDSELLPFANWVVSTFKDIV